MQKILAVSGVKNSGKTTFLTKLIPALRDLGIKTAVIKHDGHSFLPDREGTDTYRLLEAGAYGAAVFDGYKFQAVKYARVTEWDLLALYPEADLILLEGFKASPYPKLEILRGAVSSAPVCDPATLLALVTDTSFQPAGVPVFGLEDAPGVARLLRDWLAEESESLLSQWDGKLVRITDKWGDVFEGECMHNGAEYCLQEFGRAEEALQIDDWLFYAGTIRRVEPIREKEIYTWRGLRMHCMSLRPEPFRRMEAGEKTLELRLNDPKRQRLRAGDLIRFVSTAEETDVLRVRVKELLPFPDFAALYRSVDLLECGYTREELPAASPKDMEAYYSPADQARWGVLGIRIEPYED